MNRRVQSILFPLALASLAAGCSAIPDDDVIARVGDSELTDEVIAERAADAGLPPDEGLDIAVTRQIIGSWINETAFDEDLVNADDPRDIAPERVAARFDRGIVESGVSCPAFLVTETVGEARDAADELRGGADFVDVFGDRNVDPSLVPTLGLIGCPTLGAVLGAGDAPEAEVLLDLDAEDRYGVAEILDPAGEPQVSVVVDFRPFDELDEEGLQLADATVRSVIALDDIDITVNPRYGVFDPVSGAVVPLG